MSEERPVIKEECVDMVYDGRFVRVMDLKYAKGCHYLDATRRTKENIVAIKSDEEFRVMLPDAVTCFVIVKIGDEERLLLNYEYRYPAGRFLLSPVAGLIDPEDYEVAGGAGASTAENESAQAVEDESVQAAENVCAQAADSMSSAEYRREQALLGAARREIKEETGITVSESDKLFVVSAFTFSTPGMTDESNALVCAVITLPDVSILNHDGAVGSECFKGFELLSKDEARKLLTAGCDKNGFFYSLHTYCALMYFVNDMWKQGGLV